MDEAERCHEIAYVAYGELLTHGTVEQVIRSSALQTWTVTGPGLQDLADKLLTIPGVGMVAPFGASLHVSGRDPISLARALEPFMAEPQLNWELATPSLEDVFIDLIGRSKDNFEDKAAA